jgi:hypothetical protein
MTNKEIDDLITDLVMHDIPKGVTVQILEYSDQPLILPNRPLTAKEILAVRALWAPSNEDDENEGRP